MLKYTNHNVVFREIPDEVTLAINLSNCPHRCPGCHSPYLQEDVGQELDSQVMIDLLRRYQNSITCVCFMGGDADAEGVCQLATLVREFAMGKIKTAWYSGCNTPQREGLEHCFDFIKLGPYIESLGGLDKHGTNQRLYHIYNGEWKDITYRVK